MMMNHVKGTELFSNVLKFLVAHYFVIAHFRHSTIWVNVNFFSLPLMRGSSLLPIIAVIVILFYFFDRNSKIFMRECIIMIHISACSCHIILVAVGVIKLNIYFHNEWQKQQEQTLFLWPSSLMKSLVSLHQCLLPRRGAELKHNQNNVTMCSFRTF